MISEPTENQPGEATANQGIDDTGKPLPCRGCTRHCRFYGRFDGRPWRMDDLS